MRFIDSIDFFRLVNLISDAHERIFLSLPSIDFEVAELLAGYKGKANIKIVIDNSEETIRNGYGELKGIEKLRLAGIELKESEGNLISFIIVDEIGYFLFPESKIFSADPRGTNAVKIDPVTIELLVLHFFKTADEVDESDEHTKAIGKSYTYFEKAFEEILENGIEINSKAFDEDRYIEIKENLVQNPPIQPDIRRILDVYTTRFQYVELIAKNIKIGQHRANMPEDSIPVQNKELRKRLISSIKAFEDIERSIELLELGELESKVKDIRKKYLIPITCRNGKNIIRKEQLEAFRNSVQSLNEEFKTISQKLKSVLTAEIEKTIVQIRQEWKLIFKQFPPDELKNVPISSADYQKKIDLILNRMIREIKFPPLDKIISEFSLSAYYFELTWDDLKDDKLMEELCKKGVIETSDQIELAKFKKVVGARK